MKNTDLEALASEFSERAEKLEEKLVEIRNTIHEAEDAAYKRGLKVGMEARTVEFTGKTLLIQVPEDDLSDTERSMHTICRQLNCKAVVVSDVQQISELHDVELSAIGLKRIEG